MEIKEFRDISIADTGVVATYIAGLTTTHRLFTFEGSMGSGKTTLISAILNTLNGNEASASSPTFSIVNVYSGPIPLYHFDLYRLEKPEDALNAGLIDMMEDGTICMIEWPELILPWLGNQRVEVRISMTESNTRNITIKIPDHE